jgi:uncharacterized protein YegP (UPF0339 family)
MATETREAESAYDGRLFELYTKYVSEPESKKDVYGYTLLLVGYVLAMLGMLIFLVGPTGSEVPDPTQWLVIEAATLPLATGLVLSLFGIVMLLPVTRNSLVVALLGLLVGLAGVAMFFVFYPQQWQSGPEAYSQVIIGIYSLGVVLIVGVVVMVPVITGERSYFSETTEGHEFEHPEIMIGDADRGGLFAVFRRGTDWTWRFIDQHAVAESTAQFLSQLEAEERIEAVKELVANAGLLEIKHAAFRLYETETDRWQWVLMREDGSAIAEGESDFDSRDAAEASINAMKDHGPEAEIFVMDEGVYETYRENGEWGWRLVDEDRTELARSTAAFASRDVAADAHEQFRELSTAASELVIEHYGVELQSAGGRWTWRMRDSAHREIAVAETDFESKGVTEDAVYDLLDRLQRAPVIGADTPTYDVYRTGDTWQWRLVDDRGATVATGRASTTESRPAAEGASAMQAHAAGAEVVQIEDQEFETYQADGEWHWRLLDADRNVTAASHDAYESEEAASAIVDRVRREAPDADLIEFDTAAFQIYETETGTWRWRLIDEDGTVMADSGRGDYDSKDAAMTEMMTIQEKAPDAEHLEIENAAFEIFEDEDGWGWRLVDELGDIIADGTTRHDSEDGARQSMDRLIGTVSEVPERIMAAGIFQIYADAEDEWWWEFVLPDGSVVADAARSYGTRHEVESEIEDLREMAADAPVETIGRLAVLLDPSDWSWDLVDADRDPIAAGSRAYDDRQTAVAAIDSLQEAATETTVYEIRDAAFDCYRSDDGWTWRLIDPDHEPLAHAPATYDDLATAEAALETVTTLAPDADFFDYDEVAFECHQDEAGWTWELVDEDQRTIAVAASRYETRQDAEADIAHAREDITEASVIEIDSAAFEFDHTDEGWRWRLVDRHGDELAESIETFDSRAAAQEQLTTVKDLGPDSWISFAE